MHSDGIGFYMETFIGFYFLSPIRGKLKNPLAVTFSLFSLSKQTLLDVGDVRVI